MPFRGLVAHFDSAELAEMEQAFHAACQELGLSRDTTEEHRRGRLAQLIVELAKEHPISAPQLQKAAVAKWLEPTSL